VNALLLMTLLSLTAEPEASPVLAGLQLSAGARAVAPSETFNAGLGGFLGLRFGPVRFGPLIHVLFSRELLVDLGGFFTVDLVRMQLEPRLSVALFTGVETFGRVKPALPARWSVVVQGVFGLRALGVSLSFVGGAELPVPAGVLGTGEVRLGVELVELITFFKLQSQTSLPVF